MREYVLHLCIKMKCISNLSYQTEYIHMYIGVTGNLIIYRPLPSPPSEKLYVMEYMIYYAIYFIISHNLGIKCF